MDMLNLLTNNIRQVRILADEIDTNVGAIPIIKVFEFAIDLQSWIFESFVQRCDLP